MVPREPLTPLCLFPRARERPRPRAQLWHPWLHPSAGDEAISKLPPQDTSWRPKAQHLNLLMSPSCQDNPKDLSPQSDTQSTSSPAMAQEHHSCPRINIQNTRVGSTSLAGWAALSFPWMPIPRLKAEPQSASSIQPNKEAFLNSSNSSDSEQYGKSNLPFHPLLACKSGSSFFSSLGSQENSLC